MTFDPIKSVFYLLDPDKKIAGAGFYLSMDLAVTSARAAAAAGGKPGDRIEVVFPNKPETGRALVLPAGRSSSDKVDLAFLQLENHQGNSVTLGFSDESGGRACVYMVSTDPQKVSWQRGIIAGVVNLAGVPEPLLEIFQDGEQAGVAGSPVVDLFTGMVVGLLCPSVKDSSSGQDAYTYAELADTLEVYWPELKLSHVVRDPVSFASHSPTLFFQANPGSQTPELSRLIGRQGELRALDQLLNAAMQKKKPGLVFLTGIFGSGTKALGRAFIEVNQDKAALLFTRFWPLHEAVENILQDARWSIEIKACKPYLENARFLNLPEYVGLLPVLAQAFRQKLISSETLSGLTSIDQVRPLLVDLFSSGRPVLLLLEDVEYAAVPWLVWIKELTQAPSKGAGGLILAALHSLRPLAELSAAERSIAQSLALELTAKRQADAIHLGPILSSDIVTYLGGAQPGLAVQLHTLARGTPLLVDNLWESLNSRGQVNQRFDGSWELDGRSAWVNRRSAQEYIQEILAELYNQPDPPSWSKETMFDLLACAAQEGPVFTAEALASAFQLDLGELLAAFDYILDAEFEDGYVQTGLIIDIEPLKLSLPSVGWQVSLHRFRFQPLFIWRSLFEDNCPPPELLNRFADSLAKVTWPFAGRSAGILGQLYARAGNGAEAARYRAVIQAGDHFSVLQAEIALLEKSRLPISGGVGGQNRLQARLLDLYRTLLIDGIGSGLKPDTLRQAAAEIQTLAQALGRQADQYYAEFQLAEIDNRSGRASAAAKSFERLIPIYEANGQEDFLLICLLRLGEINLQQNHLKRARELLDRVLDLASEHENDQAAAVAIKALAAVDYQQGQFEKAVEGYNQAIELFQNAGLDHMVRACQDELKKVRKGKR